MARKKKTAQEAPPPPVPREELVATLAERWEESRSGRKPPPLREREE